MRRLQATLAVALSIGSAAAAPSTLQPYTALAWTAPARPMAHVVGAIRYQSTSDPARIAEQLRQRPPGTRVLLRWESNDNHVWHHPADQLRLAATQPTTQPAGYQGPWLPNGAAAESAFESRFAAALRDRGATVDYLILDTEMGVGTWNLSPEGLAAITRDPRWPAVARAFGVDRTDGLADPDRFAVLATPAARRFNRAMQATAGRAFRAAFFEPWTRVFPGVHGSDFGDAILDDAQAADAPDDNGVVQPMASPMHGDTQSPYCYAWVHRIGRPPNNRGADFGRPLTVLCWLSDVARAHARTPIPVVPWLAANGWTDGTVAIRDSAWQDELAWHVCLSAGATNVLFFNPDGKPTDDAAMDDDLAALQAQAGHATTLRPLTTAAVPFDAEVLVSGAVTPTGRRVYRVTVAGDGRRAHVVLPGESAATAVDVPAGSHGVWVVRG